MAVMPIRVWVFFIKHNTSNLGVITSSMGDARMLSLIIFLVIDSDTNVFVSNALSGIELHIL